MDWNDIVPVIFWGLFFIGVGGYTLRVLRAKKPAKEQVDWSKVELTEADETFEKELSRFPSTDAIG